MIEKMSHAHPRVICKVGATNNRSVLLGQVMRNFSLPWEQIQKPLLTGPVSSKHRFSGTPFHCMFATHILCLLLSLHLNPISFKPLSVDTIPPPLWNCVEHVDLGVCIYLLPFIIWELLLVCSLFILMEFVMRPELLAGFTLYKS